VTPDDPTRTPYSPESATSKVEVLTPQDLLYQLEEKIRDTHDPVDKYDLLQQWFGDMLGLLDFKIPRPNNGGEPSADRQEWQAIFDAVSQDEVPEPETPVIETQAFRLGMPHYELRVGEDNIIAHAYGSDLKTVAVDIWMVQQRRKGAKAGLNRLWPWRTRAKGLAGKYKLWDEQTRIHRVETGYDAQRRRQNLQRQQELRGSTAPEPPEPTRGE
jgi:hypothetical protein